jgi:hypothetical protein
MLAMEEGQVSVMKLPETSLDGEEDIRCRMISVVAA